MAGSSASPSTNRSSSLAGHDAGHLFIISAPSGAGKTTLCDAVRNHFKDLAYSISYTTRPKRPGEQAGRDYFYISDVEFERGITEGHWAEWARVHGYYYGTSAMWIQQTLADAKDILMDIDVQGTYQMVKQFSQAVTIFIMPPSIAVLEHRLTGRGQDDKATIDLRLKNAKAEMAHHKNYRHVLVNDDLAQTTKQLIGLMQHYRSQRLPG